MAQCLMELEDYGAAIAHAKHATRALPSWRHGYHTLARAQLCGGKFSAAVRNFERVITCFEGGISSDDGRCGVSSNWDDTVHAMLMANC